MTLAEQEQIRALERRVSELEQIIAKMVNDRGETKGKADGRGGAKGHRPPPH
jgi:hypothetical protein